MIVIKDVLTIRSIETIKTGACVWLDTISLRATYIVIRHHHSKTIEVLAYVSKIGCLTVTCVCCDASTERRACPR